ncbi:MAG: type II toxin-antitoxin system RelE/ParE family toxin [Parvularculaceae bacterium]
MSRKVFLRPAAERDLLRLAEFVIEKNPKAASEIQAELRRAILSLGEFGERGRPGPRDDMRELIVSKGAARYVIRYQLTSYAVRITRIWHGREDR